MYPRRSTTQSLPVEDSALQCGGAVFVGGPMRKPSHCNMFWSQRYPLFQLFKWIHHVYLRYIRNCYGWRVHNHRFASEGTPPFSWIVQYTQGFRSGYQVDKFVADSLSAVDNLDIDTLKSLWDLWKSKVFNSLSGENARLTIVYETDMYRLYLVKCMENKRMDKCNQFFLKCAALTQNNPAWTEWFAFPYHPKPEACQAFRKYYSHEWREIFVISLHNFVRIAVQSSPRSHLVQMVELLSEESESMNSLDRSHGANFAMMNPFEDELMDDFAVIAQCSGTMKMSASKPSLKAFFKNLTSGTRKNTSSTDS
ncbi:hypothetical protein Y032_0093g2634 [Ancylostoma ceylanicum]|uniref:ARMC9 CTLH-like domain-containing protein n=1 Tax=Ancylostoma ceylanicum TaxID=53326 RepID=A0A016TLW6_9BILA|nr:hypothetical protein Y032_0093g2634 [Ancylostoma ceylanicum]